MLNPHELHVHEYNKGDHHLADRFAKELQKELGTFLREVVFFGSAARRSTTTEAVYGHDIDVLIIIDDLKRVVTKEFVEAYRIITENVAHNVSARLHINTLKISAFWEYLAQGDPIALNILRDGIPLLQTGFVEPLQALYQKGRIRPSKENVFAYYLKAPETIQGAKWHLLQGVIDCYWASLDITHAALLQLGLAPNSPGEIYEFLQSTLEKRGYSKSHSLHLLGLKKMTDGILSRDIKEVSGRRFDEVYRATEDYILFTKKWISEERAKRIGAL